MANYINSEILAEAYTHLDIDIFDDKAQLERLRNDLTVFFKERASVMFGHPVDVRVEFEEGSLKTKIIAFGSAALTLGAAVANYGDFRSGVNQLSNDATAIAQAANLEVIFRTKTPHCDRLRIEKRKGVFGRVSALINELDAVSEAIATSKLPNNEVRLQYARDAVDKLLQWQLDSQMLFEKFDDPETISCVALGLLAELKKVPRKFSWEAGLRAQKSLSMQMVDADPQVASEVAGVAARLPAAVSSIEKWLRAQSAPPTQVAATR